MMACVLQERMDVSGLLDKATERRMAAYTDAPAVIWSQKERV